MDRDYWRSEPTKRLIEEARTKGCELCIALGERLEEADDDVVADRTQAEDREDELRIEIFGLRNRIEEAEEQLYKREERIEQLEAQLTKETKK